MLSRPYDGDKEHDGRCSGLERESDNGALLGVVAEKV